MAFLIANILFEIVLLSTGVGFVASVVAGLVFGHIEDKALTYVKNVSCRK